MQTTQNPIAKKIATLTEADAIAAYCGLRVRVMQAHANGEQADNNTHTAMLHTGNALEARIGATRFDALMDEIDRKIFN